MTSVIEKQLAELTNIPTYLDDRIKSIPVKENGDPIIDINAQNDPNVKMLPTPEIPFSSPDYNAGFKCSSFIRSRVFERLKMLPIYVSSAIGRKITIRVFEALRDIETQRKLYDCMEIEIRKSMPNITQEELNEEVRKIVCHPDDIPPHSTGACADILFFDEENQEFLDMGKFGNMWGFNNQAHSYSSGLTDIQKKNRSIVFKCIEFVGLVNYPHEWWHFSFGDKYFSYYTDNKYSIYGPV